MKICNGESRHLQAGVICGPSQNVYDCEKKFRKFTDVSEKIGVKDFSLGAISPSSGEVIEKKSCVVYMGARVLRARGSIMSIFNKRFQMCHLFALLMTSLILGGVRGTKNRTVCVICQSECYVKISSTGNEV